MHTTDELKLTRHRDNGDYNGDGVEDALDVSMHPVCVGDVDISSVEDPARTRSVSQRMRRGLGTCPAPTTGNGSRPCFRRLTVSRKAANRRLTEENPS